MERLRVTLGERFSFTAPRVNLVTPTGSSNRSVILLAIGGRLTKAWSLDSLVQYNPVQSHTESYNVMARYKPEAGKLLNLGYRFTRNTLRTADVSGQWPLFLRWHGVARLNPDGSLDVTFDPGTGGSDYVSAVLVQGDGNILVVGAFTNFNGQPFNRVVRLNTDGTIDPSFNPGTGANDVIHAETPIGEEEDSHLGDFIEDKAVISPQEAVISSNLSEQTRKVLSTLTPREEKVLRMRFGIGEKYDHTLEEVGQDLDVTRERIRQIEAKALRKLRHPSRAKKLKAFVES